MQKRQRRVRGFTFLEVLVTAVILVLVATILLRGSAAARRSALVRTGAQQVASFLRETGGLALNGVKAPNCDPTQLDCSRYRVTFAAAGRRNEYVRRAVGGGAEVRVTLPTGAVFPTSDQTIEFSYTPPTLNATPAPVTISVTHVTGGTPWLICVTALGSVEVRTTPCPPPL